MKIVFLDACSVGNSDTSAIAALGEYICYNDTTPEQTVERCIDADVIISNKVKLLRPELDALPQLKLICIAATGINNVDLNAAAEKGIPVKNVADYSTDSVAQLTFMLALNLIHQTGYQDNYVKSGQYSHSGLFTNYERPFFELKGKQWGIIGMGHIGRRVAAIATTFGAHVSYFSTSGKNLKAGYPLKKLDDLLSESDLVSIHAPLNEQTRFLINYEKLCLMKPTAFIINVGRGKIIKETDLVRVLRENKLAGAGLDVYEKEPLPAGNQLLSADISDKLILTPHIAWASVEARQRLVNTIAQHIRDFYTI